MAWPALLLSPACEKRECRRGGQRWMLRGRRTAGKGLKKTKCSVRIYTRPRSGIRNSLSSIFSAFSSDLQFHLQIFARENWGRERRNCIAWCGGMCNEEVLEKDSCSRSTATMVNFQGDTDSWHWQSMHQFSCIGFISWERPHNPLQLHASLALSEGVDEWYLISVIILQLLTNKRFIWLLVCDWIIKYTQRRIKILANVPIIVKRLH